MISGERGSSVKTRIDPVKSGRPSSTLILTETAFVSEAAKVIGRSSTTVQLHEHGATTRRGHAEQLDRVSGPVREAVPDDDLASRLNVVDRSR